MKAFRVTGWYQDTPESDAKKVDYVKLGQSDDEVLDNELDGFIKRNQIVILRVREERI